MESNGNNFIIFGSFFSKFQMMEKYFEISIKTSNCSPMSSLPYIGFT